MDITLYWKYLRHDIDQWTWRLGEAWKEQGVHRAEAQSDDSEADVNFTADAINYSNIGR